VRQSQGFDRATEIVEFACPHCGTIIGDVAYFQTFEWKVAAWLKGRVAGVGNKGFDVYKCDPFPELKFQVKYSTIYHFTGNAVRHKQRQWTYFEKFDNLGADYYILFGLDEDREHCFLTDREAFLQHACPTGKGGRILQCSPNRFSRIGTKGGQPFIWSHLVDSPEDNLIEAVLRYGDSRPARLF
jgi:hypothetical protein